MGPTALAESQALWKREGRRIGWRDRLRAIPRGLWVLAVLLLLANGHLWGLRYAEWLIFLPDAVAAGEWWRAITHPFVHASWWHLALDGIAFALAYRGLDSRATATHLASMLNPRRNEWRQRSSPLGGIVGGKSKRDPRRGRVSPKRRPPFIGKGKGCGFAAIGSAPRALRLLWTAACCAGSVLAALLFSPIVYAHGLCGLSGIAHGMTALNGLEIVRTAGADRSLRRMGLACTALVVAKSIVEAVRGDILFAALHLGSVGVPVAVCHAGGVLGGLCAWLVLTPRSAGRS